MTTTQNDLERRLRELAATWRERAVENYGDWTVAAEELDSALGVPEYSATYPFAVKAAIPTEAGALTVEQVKSCMVATSTTKDDDEWWRIVTGNINAALRASLDKSGEKELTFEEWYESYDDIKEYDAGMRDAFEAGKVSVEKDGGRDQRGFEEAKEMAAQLTEDEDKHWMLRYELAKAIRALERKEK